MTSLPLVIWVTDAEAFDADEVAELLEDSDAILASLLEHCAAMRGRWEQIASTVADELHDRDIPVCDGCGLVIADAVDDMHETIDDEPERYHAGCCPACLAFER